MYKKNFYEVKPSKLSGSLTIPPSKSHTMRALYFASMAKGTSFIKSFLDSPDMRAMAAALQQFGSHIEINRGAIQVVGNNSNLQSPKDVIHCGNSGQVLRFVGALAGLLPSYTLFTGDESIRFNRPVTPLLDGLNQLGAFAISSLGDGCAPMVVRGVIERDEATIDGADSQPVSGLLMAGAFAPHPIKLHVSNPGETPWVDLTLFWLSKMGIPYNSRNHTYFELQGKAQIEGFHYEVPGDFSTAAFPIAAALITGSQMVLTNLDFNDCQGDKALLPLLEQMGAHFDFDHAKRALIIHKGTKLCGIKIDINACIDALPILAVLGCFAEGRTEIVNGAIARKKESDRIHCIALELRKMGAFVYETEDGLVIEHSHLRGADLEGHNDHRIAMALIIAALGAETPSRVQGIECIAKSYPSFYDDLKKIGVSIH